MSGLYAYGGVSGRGDLFGINALGGLRPVEYLLAAALAFAVAALVAVVDPKLPTERPWFAPALAVIGVAVFFLLRSNVLNQDGNMLTPKFAADVPRIGAHLTHDELLELFVHSRVWYYTSRWWGWSVVFSYRILSCLAGGAFVYALLRLAPRLAPRRAWLFLAGVLSAGYMQLFFGDAENYTMTAALVAYYLLASLRFLSGEIGMWVPTVVLAVAICFHLEAGWLLPTWCYLAAVSHKRTAAWRDATRSAGIAGAIVIAVFAFFHFYGLSIRQFASSHAGHALRMNGVFAVGMGWSYYFEQLNLLLLLCPAAAMLIVVIPSQLRRSDEVTRFLTIGAASMLIFQVVWKAQLGVYDDWNLYAIGGFVIGVFLWRAISDASDARAMRLPAALLAAAAAVHSYAWILTNHLAH